MGRPAGNGWAAFAFDRGGSYSAFSFVGSVALPENGRLRKETIARMKMPYAKLLILMVLALPTAAAAQGPGYTEDRLNQLQQSITLLTGQIEQLQYKNQQLQQQLEKMQADYEYRLDQLEKGRGGGGPRASAPPPGPPSAPPAQHAGAAPPPGPANTADGDQLYHDAFKMLQDGDYAGAEKGFKTFVQRNPQHVLAGNAQYWLGETFYARRDYQNAMAAFAEGYKVYKTSPKGPDNLLKLGVTLAVLNRKSDACAVFARFNQDYPRATDLQKRRIDQERQKNGCG
jgi:tol-pal system protein YbgF